MKALPRFLSCLLVSSVAWLNSGTAWSAIPANKSQAQTPTKNKVKRARQARAATKHVLKPDTAPAAVPAAPAVTAPPAAVAVKAPVAVVKAPEPVLPAAAPARENPYAAGVPAVARPSAVNPYLPSQPGAAAMPTAAPVVAAVAAAAATPPTPPSGAAAVRPDAATLDAASERAWAKIVAGPAAAAPASPVYAPAANPYLVYRASPQPAAPKPPVAAGMTADQTRMFNDLRNLLPEPHLPSADIDILPSITKVYPTGERPMYVLTFKCPTELVGITPPPTKALRWLITGGMDAVNSTNLLPFSMQQVCQ